MATRKITKTVDESVMESSITKIHMSRKRSRLMQSYNEEEGDEPSISKRRKLGSVGQLLLSLPEPLMNIEKPVEKLHLARRFIGFLACCVPFGGLFGFLIGGLFGGLLVAFNGLAECLEAWHDVCNIEKWNGLHDVIEKFGKAVKSTAAIVNSIFPHPYALLLAVAALFIESGARITKIDPVDVKDAAVTTQVGQCGQIIADVADLTLVSGAISRKQSLLKRISKIGKAFTKMSTAFEKSTKIPTDQPAEKTAAHVLSIGEKLLEAIANFLHFFRFL